MRPYAFAAAALIALSSAPSHADSTRTWVSGTGDDANPCSRTAPCKTFAGAISKTAASGEINTIDAAAFGSVTITKAITIRSESEAGVLVSSGNAITVSAGAGDRVVLEGLDIEGLGPGASNTSLNGVKIVSGAAVYIIRCKIRGFTSADKTDGNGLLVSSSTSGARVVVQESFIENNIGGIKVQGGSGPSSTMVLDTLVDGNSNFALAANGTGKSIGLVRSTVTGSPRGIVLANGGTVMSFGPSNVITGTGTLSATVTYR